MKKRKKQHRHRVDLQKSLNFLNLSENQKKFIESLIVDKNAETTEKKQ